MSIFDIFSQITTPTPTTEFNTAGRNVLNIGKNAINFFGNACKSVWYGGKSLYSGFNDENAVTDFAANAIGCATHAIGAVTSFAKATAHLVNSACMVGSSGEGFDVKWFDSALDDIESNVEANLVEYSGQNSSVLSLAMAENDVWA